MAAVEQPSEKEDKLGIQSGCSQEQLKKEMKEGEKLARQGDTCSQEKPKKKQKQEGRRAWELKGGSERLATNWRFRKSATPSLRSRNLFSFQLSGG